MKKVKLLILIGAISILTACMHPGKHTTIVVRDDHNTTKIEYAGKIIFNDQQTRIEDISIGGYVRYQHNDIKIDAENDGHGNVAYEIYSDGDKQPMDEKGKKLLSDAVKDIIERSSKK